MKYLFFLFSSSLIYTQSIVSGNVLSENGFAIQNVLVVNIKTGNKIFTNNKGNFKIEANINDELRFIKENYERVSKVIYNNDVLYPMSIQLIKVPVEIEEVNITPKLTGNLEKDSKNHSLYEKTIALNDDIRQYVKKPMTEIQPKNNIPSSFAPRDPYAGQLNLLSISIGGASGGLIGLLLNEGIKKNKIKPNFSEIQNFHKKVKETFYGDYYIKQGLNESDFDAYIVYLDNKYMFSDNYFNNFDSSEIEKILKNSLKEFIN